MISEEEAGKIFDKIFNRNECIMRIKEMTQKRVFFGISKFLIELLDDVYISFFSGSFAGCIILSGVLLETALEEELMKEGCSKNSIKNLELERLINLAEKKGIIKKDTADKAHDVRRWRGDCAHADSKQTYLRVIAPNAIEDWCQVIDREEKAKAKARDAITKANEILLEIYSDQRYPP